MMFTILVQYVISLYFNPSRMILSSYGMPIVNDTINVSSVFILHKNEVFAEVDMNGTRYGYADDRTIGLRPNEWKHLYLTPVIINSNKPINLWNNKENDEQNKLCEYSKNFIKEAFARCVGNVTDVQLVDPSFDPTSQNKLLLVFDSWYDNRFTGFIRYSLNRLSKSNIPSFKYSSSGVEEPPVYISIMDDKNNEYFYQLSIANEKVESASESIIINMEHNLRHNHHQAI